MFIIPAGDTYNQRRVQRESRGDLFANHRSDIQKRRVTDRPEGQDGD